MSVSDEIKKFWKKLEIINEAAGLARPVFGKKSDSEKLGLSDPSTYKNLPQKEKNIEDAIKYFLQGMEMGLGETPAKKEKLIQDAAKEYGLNLTELKAAMIRRKLNSYAPPSRVYKESYKSFKEVLEKIEKKKK